MDEEKLGIEFLAKLTGFNKLTNATRNVEKLKKRADQASSAFARFNKAVQRIGEVGGRMQMWGSRTMMMTGLVYQAAQDLSRKFYNVVDAFASVETKGKELGMVLAPMGGDIKKSIDLATQSALDFSRKYSSSATEIMEAQYLIASAGINKPLITTKAAEWTIKLARATRENVASAANIWANAANTFYDAGKMTESEMKRLSDTLAKTQQKFQFENLFQLGDGLSYTGAAARELNISIESTATLLGTLNSAGIQGSMAGTSLQQTFLKLNKAQKKLNIQFKYNKDGSLDVVDAFRQLKARIQGMSSQAKTLYLQQLFGDRAFKSAATIISKIDQVEKDLLDVSSAVGVTERSFEDMEHTIRAAFAKIKNNFFYLFTIIGGKVAPSLLKATELAIKFVDKLSQIIKTHPALAKLIGGFLGVGAAIAGIGIPLMIMISMFSWGIGSCLTMVGKLSNGIKILRGAIVSLNAVKVGTNITSGITGASGAVHTLSFGIKASLIPALTSLAAAAGPLILIAAGIAAIYGTIRAFQEKKKIDEARERIDAAKHGVALEKIYRKRIAMYKELEAKKIKGIKLTKQETKAWEVQRAWMERSKYAAMIRFNAPKVIMPKIPGMPDVPSPADVGIPTPATITATRPEINNYYYTTHFERDSVQINTAKLSPEKFLSLLEEVIRRKALVNEPA